LATEEVFKTETDDVREEDAVKIFTRRFDLSEFESLMTPVHEMTLPISLKR